LIQSPGLNIQRDTRRRVEDQVLHREANHHADCARRRPDADDRLLEDHADDAGHGQQENHDPAKLHNEARRHTPHRVDENAVPDDDADQPADDESRGQPHGDFERATGNDLPGFGQRPMLG
jgi:hypothetical protein